MEVKSLFKSNEYITIEEYIKRCGAEKPYDYLCRATQYIENPDKYNCMTEGFQMLSRACDIVIKERHKKIYLVQDSDVDGLTSCAIAYMYLVYDVHVPKEQVVVLFHKHKEHGLSKDIFTEIKDDCALVWLPDAATNDMKQCSILRHRKINVLITDHHDATVKNQFATIINNQTSKDVQNKNLSGVGVTFKFIQFCCQKTGSKFYTKILDLVMLGNIGDVMDFRSIENRAINFWGLRHIQNPFFKILCNTFIADKVTPKNIAFNVVPKLNAVQRSNNQDLKESLFYHFVSFTKDYDEIIRQLKAQHSKQTNDTNKMFRHIVANNEPTDDKVMIIETDEDTPYTGLVANKLQDYYHKSTILVHNDSGQMKGSCRAYGDLLTPINQSNLVDFALGHKNVFGVGFPCSNTTKLQDYLNNIDIKKEVVEVTAIYDRAHPLKNEAFFLANEYAELWGNGMPQPKFYFEIPLNEIKFSFIGKRENVLKFKWENMEFIKFNISKALKKEFNAMRDLHGDSKLCIVGELSINTWNGLDTKQCIILEHEVE